MLTSRWKRNSDLGLQEQPVKASSQFWRKSAVRQPSPFPSDFSQSPQGSAWRAGQELAVVGMGGEEKQRQATLE